MSRGTKEPDLRPAWWIAYGIVIGLAAAGLILLLAAPQRGQPIQLIPAPTRVATSTALPETAVATAAPLAPPTQAIIDINMATATQLDQLPGVGPTLAQSIVAYREAHGPFANIDDLLNVPGIGQRTLDAIRPFIIIADP
jgi:competence ComEA-like helix-hairpin-helix protein